MFTRKLPAAILPDLLKGLPPSLGVLSRELLSSLGGSTEESTRAMLSEVLRREPGLLFREVFEDPEVRPSKSFLEVDEDLKPYYGYTMLALKELRQLGLPPPYEDFWLQYFLKDHPVYRVNVICCLCLAGLVLTAGIPSKLKSFPQFSYGEVSEEDSGEIYQASSVPLLDVLNMQVDFKIIGTVVVS